MSSSIIYFLSKINLTNILALFRAEIDVEPDYLNTDFYMEVELFFSDLSSMGGPDKW